MKANKGNCFVVMDRNEYNKMRRLLNDKKTYEKVTKQPFKKIERELNASLLNLKNQGKLEEKTYLKLHSTDGSPPAIRGSVKHHKQENPLRPVVTSIGSALTELHRPKHTIHIGIRKQRQTCISRYYHFKTKRKTLY